MEENDKAGLLFALLMLPFIPIILALITIQLFLEGVVALYCDARGIPRMQYKKKPPLL